MNIRDREAALKISNGLLEQRNPGGDEDPAVNRARITELFEELERNGIQQSSLKESDVRTHCMSLGLSESETNEVIEEWASWAVTDDV